MNKRTALPVAALFLIASIALGLKYYLANAPLGYLKFLLYPLAFATEIFYSTHSYFDSEHGYVFPKLSMHIDRSCSGINFLVLLLCSASSYILFKTPKAKWKTFLPFVFILVYPVSIMVNIIRIILLVYIQPFNSTMSLHLQSIVHEGIGAFCFFGCLVTLFILAETSMNKSLMDSR